MARLKKLVAKEAEEEAIKNKPSLPMTGPKVLEALVKKQEAQISKLQQSVRIINDEFSRQATTFEYKFGVARNDVERKCNSLKEMFDEKARQLEERVRQMEIKNASH